MSQMKISPTYFCRMCGKPLVAQLKTARADKDGELLYKLMPGLEKISYCKSCRAKLDWYESQGRGDELKGHIRPVEGKWRRNPVPRD